MSRKSKPCLSYGYVADTEFANIQLEMRYRWLLHYLKSLAISDIPINFRTIEIADKLATEKAKADVNRWE